ncbi:MAG TPA: proton-conducting transporter membrane subunit [Spirillospora sp.]|nr:proton-conducting transporter membrane subunit [Spirillospora sp.]
MPPVVVVSLVLSPAIYLTGRWLAAGARAATLAALGILWLVFGLAMRDLDLAGTLVDRLGGVAFYFDGLSLLITAVVLFLSTLVTLYSGPDIRGKTGEEKYYAMLLLLSGGVIGLVSAGDLFNLWIWFEMTAISSYLLVAFHRERGDTLAACAKYLIQTASGSILVLFGIALVFAQTGTLDLAHTQAAPSPLIAVAGAFLVIGFGVKIALAPTYTWLPDAYSQAPGGISALLSGIVTISGLAALLRALALLDGLAVEWGAVLIGFGTVNIVIGNLLALRQDSVKRIFAYSSVSHIGFVLLAVGIGVYAGQPAGFISGMLHLFIHALMKALAFLAVGAASYTRHRTDSTLRVGDLAGLAGREPLLAAALIIACLSLAGVPPLAGFMSKWLIFDAGLRVGGATMVLLVIFAALNSVFSLAYYFPIVNALFRTELEPPQRALPTAMQLPVVILTGALLVVGIYPALLDAFVNPAAQALLNLFGS